MIIFIYDTKYQVIKIQATNFMTIAGSNKKN